MFQATGAPRVRLVLAVLFPLFLVPMLAPAASLAFPDPILDTTPPDLDAWFDGDQIKGTATDQTLPITIVILDENQQEVDVTVTPLSGGVSFVADIPSGSGSYTVKATDGVGNTATRNLSR